MSMVGYDENAIAELESRLRGARRVAGLTISLTPEGNFCELGKVKTLEERPDGDFQFGCTTISRGAAIMFAEIVMDKTRSGA